MPILGVIASSAKGAPAAPVSVSATNVGTSRAYNNGAATVSFTPGAGATATSFTATSSPGGFTATGASSPLTVQGLQSGVAYTFTVTATNAAGTSPASSASNSITATTVPQAPTIGTATATGASSVSVTFTAGANGGATVTSFTATSSPGSITGSNSTSPISITGLSTGTAYTFTVTATNANGTSAASAASNSATPAITVGTFSLSTAYPVGKTSPNGFSTNDRGVVVGGRTSTSGSAGNSEGWYWNGSSWTSANSTYASLYRPVTSTSATEGQCMGGEDSGSALNTTNYFNGSSWSSATNLPGARKEVYGGGSFGNNSAVIVGGSDSSNFNTHYYRTGTGSWSTGTAYPFTTPTSITHYNFTKVFVAYNNSGGGKPVYETTSLGGAWTNTGTTWIQYFALTLVNGIPFGTGNTGGTGVYSIASNGVQTFQASNPVGSSWSNFAITGRTNTLQLVSGFVSPSNVTYNYLATVTA